MSTRTRIIDVVIPHAFCMASGLLLSCGPPEMAGRRIAPRLQQEVQYQKCELVNSAPVPQSCESISTGSRKSQVSPLRGQRTSAASTQALGEVWLSSRELLDRTIGELAGKSSWSVGDVTTLSAALILRAQLDQDPESLIVLLEILAELEEGELERGDSRPWASVLFNRGLAWQLLGVDARARETWSQFLSVEPRGPWAEEAREFLDAATSSSRPGPDFSLAEWLVSPQLASVPNCQRGPSQETLEQAYLRAVKLGQNTGVDAFEEAEAGILAYSERRVGDAADLLESAIREDQGGVPSLFWRYYRALADNRLGKKTRAREQLEELIHELRESSYDASLLLGRALWNAAVIVTEPDGESSDIGRLEEAVFHLEKCGDVSGLVRVRSALALRLSRLRHRGRAWTEIGHSLQSIESAETETGFHALFSAAILADQEGYPHVARMTGEAAYRSLGQWATPPHRADVASFVARLAASVDRSDAGYWWDLAKKHSQGVVDEAQAKWLATEIALDRIRAGAVTELRNVEEALNEIELFFGEEGEAPHWRWSLEVLYLRALRERDRLGAPSRTTLEAAAQLIGSQAGQAGVYSGAYAQRELDALADGFTDLIALNVGVSTETIRLIELSRGYDGDLSDSLLNRSESEAILYLALGRDYVHIWLRSPGSRGKISYTRSPRPSAKSSPLSPVGDTSRHLVAELTRFLEEARRTWQRPAEHISIVPDSRLWAIPFELVKHGTGYLGSSLPMRYSPSLTETTVRRVDSTRSLVVGDPLLRNSGMVQLPFASLEAQAVASRLGVSALTGRAATNEAIGSRLPKATLFHFAGHLVADRLDPGASQLLTAGDPDESLAIGEIGELIGSGAVIVLGSCGIDDNRYPNTASIATVGLTLRDSGAGSIIFSRRPVPDADTFEFMRRMYDRMKEGLSATVAIKEARRQLLQEGLSNWDVLWPWVLVGDDYLLGDG